MSWTKIFASNTEYEVLLKQGYLEENGIQCVVLNQHDSMYNFGEYQLMVKSEDVLEAKRLIAEQTEQ